MMYEDRNVYVFREHRTGGTSFTQCLADILNKTFCFVSRFSETTNDPRILYNTHSFYMLEEVIDTYNPIVIRCDRKNKTEQFLSMVTWSDYHIILNINSNTTVEQKQLLDDFTKTKIIITEDKVIDYAKQRLFIDNMWDSTVIDIDHAVVYYEDMSNTIDIPVLGLYNIDFDRNRYTQQFPDYKRSVYNYDEVEEWMNKHYYEHYT